MKSVHCLRATDWKPLMRARSSGMVCFALYALRGTSNLVIFCQLMLDKSAATRPIIVANVSFLCKAWQSWSQHQGDHFEANLHKVLYRSPYLQEKQAVYIKIAGSSSPISFIAVFFFDVRSHTHTCTHNTTRTNFGFGRPARNWWPSCWHWIYIMTRISWVMFGWQFSLHLESGRTHECLPNSSPTCWKVAFFVSVVQRTLALKIL